MIFREVILIMIDFNGKLPNAIDEDDFLVIKCDLDYVQIGCFIGMSTD